MLLPQEAAVYCIQSDAESLTLEWRTHPGALRYELQMLTNPPASLEASPDTSDRAEWVSLSAKLTSTTIKKKNLRPPELASYSFRVRARDEVDFHAFAIPSAPYSTVSAVAKFLPSPVRLKLAEPTALTIAWDKLPGDKPCKYEIEMREVGKSWARIATINGTEVRKRNLSPETTYNFRIRPVFELSQDENYDFRHELVPCKTTSVVGKYLQTTFANSAMIQNNGAKHDLKTAFANKKIVLLYFSAHWCGPCRQFTPKLVDFYKQNKKSDSLFEVVFISADHDEGGFKEYFAEMPWLSIDYDDDNRERIQATYKVSGIPSLKVIDCGTGRIIEDGVREMSTNSLDTWLRKSKV